VFIIKTIRWGIIGAGRISAIFAEALNGVQGTQIVAVGSRNFDRGKNFADKMKIAKAYGSYEELLADKDIDVIYIGTPHSEHKKNVELSIKAGKAVLCEKSFTLNQKDTSYLIDLAKEHDVFLMEAMWTKFLPTTKTVKEWVKTGKIGEIKYLNINFGFSKEIVAENRLFNPQLGGGALLDVGIYPVSYAIHMMDSLPIEVSSQVIMGKTNVDEVNSMLFRFENGTIANLSSAIRAEIGKDAVIVGELGKIIIENFWQAQSAKVYDNHGNLMESFEKPFLVNGYEYEIMEVNECISENRKESELLPLADTRKIMGILDMIREQWNYNYPDEK
jgi:dihydrodiol dehydrogenase / D-xylose 1-dehydrogenase (NADP)